LIFRILDGARIRPLAAGASGCALVVLANSVEAHGWGCVPHRGCCFGRRSLCRPTRPLGSAAVIRLADPVELPDRNKTEMCHACHVTLTPSSFPSTVIPRSTNMSHPVEGYFHSSPVPLKAQGSCITTTSHIRQLVEVSGSELASLCRSALSFDRPFATLQRRRPRQTQAGGVSERVEMLMARSRPHA
jgi:hypothetical protein